MPNQYAVMIKIGILVLILSVIGALGFGTYYYHGKYEESIANTDVLKSQNAGLIAQIKADSDAMQKLADDSKAREDAAKAALENSQKEFKNYTKKAQDILLAVAQSPKDMCASADILYNNFLGLKATMKMPIPGSGVPPTGAKK